MKDHFSFEALIERFAEMKEKYGDDYPIILYEPAIKDQEKKALNDLIRGNNSINLFNEFREALKFAQSLDISFILIVSKDFEEEHVLLNFGSLKNTFGRAMIEFEEEALLKSVFKDISDEIIKALSLKVYVFCTLFDCVTETNVKEDEEEVVLMCDIKDIVKEFREDFMILWYDSSVKAESKRKLEEGIEWEIQEKNVYQDLQKLLVRIRDDANTSYHLVFSGEIKYEAQELVKEIGNLKNILGLYIAYDGDIKMKKSENISIDKTLEGLIPKIKEGIRTRSKLKYTFPAFTTNFNSSDRSGLYKLHYYLKGLINFRNRKQAKGDFINLARKIYQDQEKELARFEEKYNAYNRTEILKWYTKESPIYRLINNCLRISSPDSILYCRLILKDLEKAIREQYQEKSKDFSGEVYRGAYISKDEWEERLETNIGAEIEMYGFLSTSVNQKTAVTFLKTDLKNKILIKIIIPPLPELDEQGFADVSNFSEFRNEQEILFNVRSRFQILEARKVDNRGIKCRQLVLLYGAHALRRYITKNKPELSFKLPSETNCTLCGSISRLFSFKQKEESFVNCLECLIKGSIPKDTLLIALDAKDERGVVRTLKGKILTYKKTVTFSNCGYQCYDCKDRGKEKYYKWMSLDGEGVSTQCSECFEKKRTIENKILIAEGSPYSFWQEQEKEWETVNSDYQGFLTQRIIVQKHGDVYLEVQDGPQSIEYGKKVIEKLKSKRRREEFKLSVFYQLGRAYDRLRNFEQALGCLRIAMTIENFINEERRSNIAVASLALARVHQSLAEDQNALKYFHKAVEIQKSIYGEKHESLAFPYEGLGRVYQRIGEFQKAHEYFSQVLDQRKSAFGEKHSSTAHAYVNLGLLCQKLSDPKNALEYLTMALKILESIYGEKHPDVAELYSYIGSVYAMIGDFPRSIESEQKAVEIQSSLSNGKPDQSVISDTNFGDIYSLTNQHQKALEYLNQALEKSRSINGEKHLKTVRLLHSIGAEYEGLGDHEKALEYFLMALDQRKAILGENHAEIVQSNHNIGRLYQTFGKSKKALKYFHDALKIQKLVFPKHHPQTCASHLLLGQTYYKLRDYQKALEHYFEVLDTAKVLYGEKHKFTVSTYHHIGKAYSDSGNQQKALEYHSKALDIDESLYGEQHSETASSYDNIGQVYTSLGDREKAFEFLSKGLAIRRSILGEKHQDVATSYNNLATYYQTLGKFKKARENFIKAIKIGEKRPEAVIHYRNLSELERKLGFREKAEEYLEKALEIEGSVTGLNHP